MPTVEEDMVKGAEHPDTDRPGETADADGTLPPADSIVSEEEFTSPSGQHYRIIHTNETDASDAPPPKRKRPTDEVAE